MFVTQEIEIRSALRRQSARKRREENSKDKLLRVSSNLAEKYRAVEEVGHHGYHLFSKRVINLKRLNDHLKFLFIKKRI